MRCESDRTRVTRIRVADDGTLELELERVFRGVLSVFPGSLEDMRLESAGADDLCPLSGVSESKFRGMFNEFVVRVVEEEDC